MYLLQFNNSPVAGPRSTYSFESIVDLIGNLKKTYRIKQWFTIWRLEGRRKTQVCRIYSNLGKIKWHFPITATPTQRKIVANINLLTNINEGRKLKDRVFRRRLSKNTKWIA